MRVLIAAFVLLSPIAVWAGCRFEGRDYRVGQEWYARGNTLKCKCYSSHWSCDPVSNGGGGGSRDVKCEGRYRHGEKWTKYNGRMPTLCTCTVNGGRWSTNCVPQGCRYSDGRVYKVGDTWRSSGMTCRCDRSGSSTRWSCS